MASEKKYRLILVNGIPLKFEIKEKTNEATDHKKNNSLNKKK